MTKIIASVLTLSFAFATGVVLGARQNQPEIKKITRQFKPAKAPVKFLVKNINLKKTNILSAEKKNTSEVSSPKNASYKKNKFLNKKRTGYTVLLSSFKVEENAENYAKRIAKKGYDAFYFSKDIQGKTWHRVGVGSFSTKSTAESLKKQLSENKLGKGALISKIPRNKAL